MWSDDDIRYMRMALELARNGQGHVEPNPMVGAVIVRDGHVLARGWHHAYGDLHAERDALASCGGSAVGATMYVTLEPCCHYGKQPPCTSAIVEAGISRVVVAMTDPNPLVAGKGSDILRSHGIEVRTGLLEKEARYLNRVFIKYITTGRPWTVLKSAVTLDGRIAAASGDSKWVSCEESRRYAHVLRGRCAAVLAGIGTVMADNPMLNCRLEGMRQPVRVIADSHASLPLDSALVLTAGDYRTIAAHISDAPRERLEALRGRGVETLECTCADGHVDTGDLLGRLGAMGLSSVLVEGGGEINWSMVSGDYADEYYVFVAPKIIGGRNAKGFVGGEGFGQMSSAAGIEVRSVRPSGCDWLIHGFASKHSELCSRE
ncbi:MAG TPA: bifunctional diaminohydroxyphosphoribosylaminopyrimidine deaminase/5-amino-6-(5-phosphoribosylamino)uracil reductase RibD [Candidatus Coprenecus stercoravium]|uniref:Riboflavin biosynthesis protein RibD n=1 Tax=Candidatus Coprenecus stercoravium TaxID=2840735 RepID=A0A9D2GNQ0_9BACT|nr:bifunctional diaminohydroxyphosphoribosylaminopyrimidine deaminase/5-amino-6-(5-phosphoribosylamino)uracil reductase RibD [Candidatus Coprenecus stercoravium]